MCHTSYQLDVPGQDKIEQFSLLRKYLTQCALTGKTHEWRSAGTCFKAWERHRREEDETPKNTETEEEFWLGGAVWLL